MIIRQFQGVNTYANKVIIEIDGEKEFDFSKKKKIEIDVLNF